MNRSKVAGTRFESAVAAFLTELFPYCERRALRGAKDGGDLAGLPCVVECKATRAIDLAEAVDEAAKAAVNTGASQWVAVIKRRNRPVGKAYAVTSLENYAQLLAVYNSTLIKGGRP